MTDIFEVVFFMSMAINGFVMAALRHESKKHIKETFDMVLEIQHLKHLLESQRVMSRDFWQKLHSPDICANISEAKSELAKRHTNWEQVYGNVAIMLEQAIQ